MAFNGLLKIFCWFLWTLVTMTETRLTLVSSHRDVGIARFQASRPCDSLRRPVWVDGRQQLHVRFCVPTIAGATIAGPVCQAPNKERLLDRNDAVLLGAKSGHVLCSLDDLSSCCGDGFLFGNELVHTLAVRTMADNLTGISWGLDRLVLTSFHYRGVAWVADTIRIDCLRSGRLISSAEGGCCWCEDEHDANDFCWREGMTYAACCLFPSIKYFAPIADYLTLGPPCHAIAVQVGKLFVSQDANPRDKGCRVWDYAFALWIEQYPDALASLTLLPGKLRILELGAGVGLTAIALAKRNHSVLATDASACVLRHVKKNRLLNLRPEQYQFARAERWEWGGPPFNERFDLVLLLGGLFYSGLSSSQALVRSVRDLCTPRLRMIVQVPSVSSEKVAFQHFAYSFRILRRLDLFYYDPVHQHTYLLMKCLGGAVSVNAHTQ